MPQIPGSGGKVIQGFFIAGQARMSLAVAQPRISPHPTVLAKTEPHVFVSRPLVAQARGSDSFQVDPGRLGLGGGSGTPLPDTVRGKMEAALGADFSAVRIHVGPHAERIGAVAFTMGTDIYFAPGRFQPNTTPGQQLLGHELAHVVQQRAGRVANPYGGGIAVVQNRALEAEAERLGHRAALHRAPVQAKLATVNVISRQRSSVLQRTLVGTDPLGDLTDPAARDLLYGTSTSRSKTTSRLTIQDQNLTLDRYRTIDAYNLAIGLNAVMDKAGDPTVIFLVREALCENNVIQNWRTRFTAAVPNMETDPDLTAWITMLENNTFRIGLYDLGAPQQSRTDYAAAEKRRKKKLGLTKFSSNTRVKKNFTDRTMYQNTTITGDVILDWLAADRTYAQAQTDVSNFNTTEKTELAKWVRTAFWRRTSKLGIDFTIGRGHKIHFNTAADKTWSPTKGVLPTMKAGDLKKINTKHGRMITTSEYRHVKKGIKKGTLDPNLVNFYDEF